MSQIIEQDIFEIVPLIENIDIKLSARCENGVKHVLAVVTGDGDVVLHYSYGELTPILKRIPWFSDTVKTIQGICLDPSATWLLVVCMDCSLYIIPALSLVDKKQKIDCKWSLNDVTHFPKPPQTPDSIPTSIVWWQTLDCNQNALVGFENGAIVLISLTDGRCLGSCSISETVKELHLCQEKISEAVSLLINGVSGQQWRLFLEQHSTGYSWPPDSNNQTDDSARSRLYNLKQLGVDKLASLKQRLSEARGVRRDSQTSDTASESSHSESVHSGQSGPEMLPHLCDTFFACQYAKYLYFFSAFYKPTSLLTVHAVDVESAPLNVYKLPLKTATVLLTDNVLFTVNDEYNTISLLSNQLTECRLEGDAEFNNEALLAQFYIGKEKIQHLYRLSDLAPSRIMKNSDFWNNSLFVLPRSVDDCSLNRTKIDTCVVVTDCSVYKIIVKYQPVLKFMHLILEKNDFEAAEKLAVVYRISAQKFLEWCGDILITNGSYHLGIIIYKHAKLHLLKRVLKLAMGADCKALLKFVHLCLSASKVDMSVATKIHIGNLAVMAYTELLLRYSGPQRILNTKDFMNFLCCEEYYDQVLAVNVACQAGHWNVLTLLAKCRGLRAEVVIALGQILQSTRAPRPTDRDFLNALSEPSLSQYLLTQGHHSQIIFQFVRTNVDVFPLEILQRLAVQLDPSQPCATSLVSRVFHTAKYSSSLDTTIESVDLDNPDESIVTVKDFIDTFLYVAICLTRRTEKIGFDLELLQTIEPPELPHTQRPIKRLPDLRPLSCGYEHTAVIRNNNVYTMGVTTSGCLGFGPLLSQSSPPKLVRTFCDLKIKVLSVSCGRKHTLALTDFGVYAWGSNTYGQLGVGSQIVESPYPQILPSISSVKIVEVFAGQYHSIALTASGEVYTWGWGIHGQLGHGNCDNEFYPKPLKFSEPVKQVTAGHAHSLILTCDGKVYGFGSNIFGQLECRQMETNKSTTPVWVVVMPDMFMPIERVVTSYFHNVAVYANQEVYTWGASPQELRIFQSKNNQKQNGIFLKSQDSWKASIHIYSGSEKKPIEQVAVGYRHSVILHNGNILWGKSRDEELCSPKLRKQDSMFTQKFLHISCGLDYTMGIDHGGKLMAWGSSSMAQTLLGRPISDADALEGRLVLFKNTKRLVKFPNTGQGTGEIFPIEVPGLPSMAITFNPTDQKLLLSKNYYPFSIRRIENDVTFERASGTSLDHIYDCPKFKFGLKTLHYVLETYFGFYDIDNILSKCLDMQNYQAAAKIALLDGHFGDSLGFQLIAFKKYMETLDLNLPISRDKENTKQDIEIIVKNIQEDLNEKNLTYSNNSQSPAHILSSSSSLDSIRQWGDDIEHQGGCESPCEASDMGDVRQNITQYVQSLKSNESSPPISSVSKIVSQCDKSEIKLKDAGSEVLIKDKDLKEVIDGASYLVEFYIKKIYTSENHILMQNVLMRCIEFWLSNFLPVSILESILLKNMDKYFYPLSILLFCKDFDDGVDEQDTPKVKPTRGFLKEFSTKFCLQLCSMVLDNVNKS